MNTLVHLRRRTILADARLRDRGGVVRVGAEPSSATSATSATPTDPTATSTKPKPDEENRCLTLPIGGAAAGAALGGGVLYLVSHSPLLGLVGGAVGAVLGGATGAVASWLTCSPMHYVHGVPNLASVDTKKNVWRSGQISTPEGWAYVRSLGVKRVVKLNEESEGSDQGARDAGLEVVDLAIPPRSDLASVVEKPDERIVARAVAILSEGGALVHCTHGQDRTGLVVGVYRVTIDGWTKTRAFEEMAIHHFHEDLPALMLFWIEMNPGRMTALVKAEQEALAAAATSKTSAVSAPKT